MSDITWTKIQRSDGKESLTIVFLETGETLTIENPGHPNYDRVVDELDAQGEGYEDRVKDLTLLANSMARRFQRLSERVTTDGSSVFFDGDPIHDVVAQHILRLMEAENNVADTTDVSDIKATWPALVNFIEKLHQNKNENSREALYSFLTRYGLTIRANGDFIAYKGVDNNLKSIHSGYGIVNGVETNGQLENTPGTIIEIPRAHVDDDPNTHCSVGLHAGAMAYAGGFGSRVLAVAISPRDVVSVPNDYDCQKLRTCRYEVLVEVSRDDVRATVGETSDWYWREEEEDSYDDWDEAEEDSYEDDYCDECEDYCEDDCYCCEDDSPRGSEDYTSESSDVSRNDRMDELITLIRNAYLANLKVDFRYRRFDGTIKNYETTIDSVDDLEDGYSFIVKLNGNGYGYRQFHLDGVISAKSEYGEIWTDEENDSDFSEDSEESSDEKRDLSDGPDRSGEDISYSDLVEYLKEAQSNDVSVSILYNGSDGEEVFDGFVVSVAGNRVLLEFETEKGRGYKTLEIGNIEELVYN